MPSVTHVAPLRCASQHSWGLKATGGPSHTCADPLQPVSMDLVSQSITGGKSSWSQRACDAEMTATSVSSAVSDGNLSLDFLPLRSLLSLSFSALH